MLNSYRAIIEKGQIKWLDIPPPATSTQVIITVLSSTDIEDLDHAQTSKKNRKLGFMQGEMTIPDDVYWGDDQVQDIFGIK